MGVSPTTIRRGRHALGPRTLEELHFELPRLLLDGQATRERILGEIQALIAVAGPGDVLVFQFAGHGITVPDRDADEAAGDSPVDDKALCRSSRRRPTYRR